MQKNWLFFKSNVVLVILICLATFLRTFQLDRFAILFPDAGHDLLVAHQALENHTIPWVGIASSRPWLHQGPVSLWFEMTVIAIFGVSTYAQSLAFAFVGILAVIALYELLAIFANKYMAYGAVALLAVFPLAVAHSRVPYHVTFIPLATVLFLFGAAKLWDKFSVQNVALALVGWIFLVQFELACALLILIIPYIFWRRKYPIKKSAIAIAAGLFIVGILPQLIPVLFSQGGSVGQSFGWLLGKVISEPFSHLNSPGEKTILFFQSLWLFGGRIFSLDQWPVAVVGFTAVLFSLWNVGKAWRQKKLPPVVELTTVMLGILLGSYWVAGPPSEAYFPPFFIFFAILISYSFSVYFKKYSYVLIGVLGCYLLWNSYSIVSTHFFVDTYNAFSYESVQEHRAIAKFVAVAAQGQPYQLNTASNAKATSPSLFDHIRWLALESKVTQPGDTGLLFFIEDYRDPQPDQTITIKKFPHKTVYKSPQFIWQ